MTSPYPIADDWQVGDLALCVESGKITRAGLVYHVRLVVPPGGTFDGLIWDFPTTSLGFVEFPYRRGRLSNSARFRKIRPDEHEDCEPEFVELLNRIKRTNPLIATPSPVGSDRVPALLSPGGVGTYLLRAGAR